MRILKLNELYYGEMYMYLQTCATHKDSDQLVQLQILIIILTVHLRNLGHLAGQRVSSKDLDQTADAQVDLSHC